MTESENQSQADFVKSYFENNPNREISHTESKAALERGWEALTGKRFEDADRQIRRLHQDGFLMKVRKGVYKYDPSLVSDTALEDFSAADKKKILERDNYRCVRCGLGREDGVELHVDHIKPKDLGGTATIQNGQTLCGKHNYMKKNHSQSEVGKRMFMSLHESALADSDPMAIELVKFSEAVLKVYEKYNIDSHIEWRPSDEN